MNTKFGFNQLVKKTPEWAKWAFGIVVTLTTVAAFVVHGDPAISQEVKSRVLLYLKGVDFLMLGFANMFGVQTKSE